MPHTSNDHQSRSRESDTLPERECERYSMHARSRTFGFMPSSPIQLRHVMLLCLGYLGAVAISRLLELIFATP